MRPFFLNKNVAKHLSGSPDFRDDFCAKILGGCKTAGCRMFLRPVACLGKPSEKPATGRVRGSKMSPKFFQKKNVAKHLSGSPSFPRDFCVKIFDGSKTAPCRMFYATCRMSKKTSKKNFSISPVSTPNPAQKFFSTQKQATGRMKHATRRIEKKKIQKKSQVRKSHRNRDARRLQPLIRFDPC